MDVAREHDAAGADPAVGRVDALAHAGGIDRERRRVLEHEDAGPLDRIGERQRIGERIDLECVRIVDRAEVTIGAQHVADLFERPRLGLDAEFLSEQPRPPERRFAIVELGDLEPAAALNDAVEAELGDGVGDAANALLGQRPQRARRRQADALDDLLDRRGIARHDEAAVAARRVPGDARAFEQRDRPAAPHDLARHREAGKAAADDADVDVDLVIERVARRRQAASRARTRSARSRTDRRLPSNLRPRPLNLRDASS